MPIIEIEIELIGKVSYYHFLLPVKLGDLKPIYIYIYISNTQHDKNKEKLNICQGHSQQKEEGDVPGAVIFHDLVSL